MNKPELVGPREPWHDIHSSVRGPEAQNIIRVFSERWIKQAPHLSAEILNLSSINLRMEESADRKGGWRTQTFRSIDARVNAFDNSIVQSFRTEKIDDIRHVQWVSLLRNINKQRAVRFNEKVKDKIKGTENNDFMRRFETSSMDGFIFNKSLDIKKGRFVDSSIHTANIHHIRRAKHFIYIESQFFMGSSYLWNHTSDQQVKCQNLIPAELTWKICQKIAAGEQFTVYILLPMWPEGHTESPQSQEILYWQRKTIEAMYTRIDKALEHQMMQTGEKKEISDYLNFYCLGNRETINLNEASAAPLNDDEALLSKTRRHQIYVHSKMMIVDDEVALIGTANINQRSMDGCRDTEVMISAYQPEHEAGDEGIPHGDVHAFRMHIWATLTGQMDDAFREPFCPKCVSKMNEIAERNWRLYLQEAPVEMNSHLLPSPFEFSERTATADNQEKKLRARKELECGNFPDTNGSVVGKKSFLVPDLITT